MMHTRFCITLTLIAGFGIIVFHTWEAIAEQVCCWYFVEGSCPDAPVGQSCILVCQPCGHGIIPYTIDRCHFGEGEGHEECKNSGCPLGEVDCYIKYGCLVGVSQCPYDSEKLLCSINAIDFEVKKTCKYYVTGVCP